MRSVNWFKYLSLSVGFLFLYIPIICLVVFSFNDSPLQSKWSGFSLRWYYSLFEDTALIKAAWLSLKVAVLSATAAVVIGTWAGYVLARKGPFRGFSLYIGMLNAPLVIPDVIMGISVLLLIIEFRQWFGFPAENGIFTIWLGHVTLCSAYVAIVISARVRELDRSIEEAAMDLGASPIKVIFGIILPIILPAMLSAWMLSFTLSLDDVVIASFLSGPGYTTLPIEVFSRVRLGVKPEVNALATIVIVTIGLLIVIGHRFGRKGKI